jgi:rhodanese-related sulfurtransferase
VKSVAGGQAVLFADEHVAVRSAEIVFVDGGEGQAALTACWFRRLGYPRVSVVEGGIAALVAAGCELERGRIRAKPLQIDETRRRTKQVDVAAASAALQSTTAPTVLDVGTSKSYAAGHLPNSAWIPRGWLEAHVREAVARADAPVLVVCQNGIQSTYAAATLASLGYSDVSVLEGGLARWKQAGLPLEKGKPASTAFGSDVVKSPYERTKADMESYLAWERQLAAKNA